MAKEYYADPQREPREEGTHGGEVDLPEETHARHAVPTAPPLRGLRPEPEQGDETPSEEARNQEGMSAKSRAESGTP